MLVAVGEIIDLRWGYAVRLPADGSHVRRCSRTAVLSCDPGTTGASTLRTPPWAGRTFPVRADKNAERTAAHQESWPPCGNTQPPCKTLPGTAVGRSPCSIFRNTTTPW